MTEQHEPIDLGDELAMRAELWLPGDPPPIYSSGPITTTVIAADADTTNTDCPQTWAAIPLYRPVVALTCGNGRTPAARAPQKGSLTCGFAAAPAGKIGPTPPPTPPGVSRDFIFSRERKRRGRRR